MKDLFNNSVAVTTGPGADIVGGSTDFGNVTYRLPACHPGFAIPAPAGQGNHTPGFTNAARTPEAHEETLKAATGIAVVGARIISDEAFANEVSFVVVVASVRSRRTSLRLLFPLSLARLPLSPFASLITFNFFFRPIRPEFGSRATCDLARPSSLVIFGST